MAKKYPGPIKDYCKHCDVAIAAFHKTTPEVTKAKGWAWLIRCRGGKGIPTRFIINSCVVPTKDELMRQFSKSTARKHGFIPVEVLVTYWLPKRKKKATVR